VEERNDARDTREHLDALEIAAILEHLDSAAVC
jgi:hypothetical protein